MTIDERIEAAASRLASTPVGVPELERVVGRRARRLRVNAVVGSVVVVSIGVAALVRHEGSAVQISAKTPVPTDGRPLGASTGTFALALENARLVDDSTSTARNGPSAVWYDEAGFTYLAVTVLPGEATTTREPAGVEPMVEDTTFPSAEGRAWFSATNSDSLRRMTMWWSRSDGDVWLLDMFWYGASPVTAADARVTLRNRAPAIVARDPQQNRAHFELADHSMRRIAEDQGGDVDYRVQVWSYQVGFEVEHISLSTTEDSVATNLIAALERGDPELVRVDGHDAWQVTDGPTGDIFVGWQTTRIGAAWISLSIPAGLASLVPRIRAALHFD